MTIQQVAKANQKANMKALDKKCQSVIAELNALSGNKPKQALRKSDNNATAAVKLSKEEYKKFQAKFDEVMKQLAEMVDEFEDTDLSDRPEGEKAPKSLDPVQKAVSNAKKILADLKKSHPLQKPSSAAADAQFDRFMKACDALEQLAKVEKPGVSAFKKSYADQTQNERIMIQIGGNPDLPFVNQTGMTPARLKRMSAVHKLDSVLAGILSRRGDGRNTFMKIAEEYAISTTSSTFKRADIRDGSVGLRRTKVLELLEALKPQFASLDVDSWLETLLNTAQDFK